VNTQNQAGAQLRSMMERMSVATLSTVDEQGVLLSSRMSRWEMDDCGALWFSTDPLSLPAAHMLSLNLTFADAAGSQRVSLSGRGELYAEDLCSEYLLGSIWLGQLNSPRFNVPTALDNPALLKFTPQSAVYWQAPQSLMARLLAMLTSVFGAKVPSVNHEYSVSSYRLDGGLMQRRQPHDVL
jgi:general stress protein 26